MTTAVWDGRDVWPAAFAHAMQKEGYGSNIKFFAQQEKRARRS